MTEMIDASTDAAAANAMVAAMTAPSSASRTEPPRVESPPDTQVTLLAGLRTLQGVLTTAEVRELTGSDEEALARVTDNLMKTLDVLLQRGVVKIGDEDATPLLDGMFSGDRDWLVLAIRRVTFGPDVELRAKCPECKTEQDVTIDLAVDVPVKRLENLDDASFSLTLKSGKRVEVGLPTGSTQKKVAGNSDRNYGVLNTMLLKDCVKEINGNFVVSDSQVRDLSMRDRDEILTEITKRNPGPQLEEVKKPCRECQEEIALPLSLADLFRA